MIWLITWARDIISALYSALWRPDCPEDHYEVPLPIDACSELSVLNGLPDHTLSLCLEHLVQKSGAGSWPPASTFGDSWPHALRPYHILTMEMAQSLTVAESSLDDSSNRVRIDHFRSTLSANLASSINVDQVRRVLCLPVDEEDAMSPSDWNGFWACISFLRHAYRWGVSPVVRVAQNETSISFPPELDIPWIFLQQYHGFTSPGGNLTSNALNNARGRTLQYQINAKMPFVYRKTEHWNSFFFVDLEMLALPLYCCMAKAAYFLDQDDSSSCCDTLGQANTLLTGIFKYFYQNVNNENLNKTIWMAYAQGFHGWATGEPIVNGISGGHSILIRSLDGFLGLRPFPSDEEERVHLPLAQRQWLNCLRSYNIREVSARKQLESVKEELDNMVYKVKVWRMAHMHRMEAYISVPRPERKLMTAGISVVGEENAQDEKAMIVHLKAQLFRRLEATR